VKRVWCGRPLLPDGSRAWAGAVIAGCAVVVVVLGAVFRHQTVADGFDRAVDAPFISGLGGHHPLMLWLAAPASQLPAAVLSAAIAVGCLLAGRLNGAILAVAAVPVSVELDEKLFKPLFDRTYLGSLSYPSGHTTAMVALAVTVTLLLLPAPRPGRPRLLRLLVPALAWLLAAVVAVAVMALKWHYFTDTVGGAAVAVGAVGALALLLDRPASRRCLRWVTREPAGPPLTTGAAREPAPSQPEGGR
jgi:membrane-associated phospholipid phosphatase